MSALLFVLCLGVPMTGAVAQEAPAEGAEEAGAEGAEAPAEGDEASEGDEAEGEGEGGEAAPAPPAPKPKLMMLPTMSVRGETSSLVPERIGDTTRKRLREGGQVVLMPTFAEIRKQLEGQGASSAVMVEAERLYASGIGLITAGENAKALESFQRAVELMEQNVVDLKNYDVLADALANLALAYHLSGYDLDGRKRIKQFAHLRPEAELNPEKYPAQLLELLEQEQAKIEKAGPGKLVVTADVEGAEVIIDGVSRGVTPVTVEDVGFGYHYMVVRGPDGSAWADQIRVRGRGKEQTFEAELGGGAAVAGGEGDGEGGEKMPTYYVDLLAQIEDGAFEVGELQPYLSELSRQAGAPHIGWVLVYKEGMKYVAAPFVWRASDGALVEVEPSRFNFELSDLTVRVNELSGRIAQATVQMPEGQAVASVSLAEPEPEPVVSVGDEDADGPDTGEDPSTSPVVKKQPEERDPGQPLEPPPIEEPGDEEGSRALRYVGLGAGAVLLTGALVTGGVLLFGGGGGGEPPPAGPTGFEAEVSW